MFLIGSEIRASYVYVLSLYVHGVFNKAYYSNARLTHIKALNGCFPLFAQVCVIQDLMRWFWAEVSQLIVLFVFMWMRLEAYCRSSPEEVIRKSNHWHWTLECTQHSQSPFMLRVLAFSFNLFNLLINAFWRSITTTLAMFSQWAPKYVEMFHGKSFKFNNSGKRWLDVGTILMEFINRSFCLYKYRRNYCNAYTAYWTGQCTFMLF